MTLRGAPSARGSGTGFDVLLAHDPGLDPAAAAMERHAVRAVVRRGDSVLLMRTGAGAWKFPGGGVEDGESDDVALIAFTGAAINAVQTTMYALAAFVYPTSVRATGVGSATAVGRMGAIVSSYLGAWSIDVGGSRSFFLVIALAMTGTLIALACVQRHIPGK